jgi:rare lipoprotein A
MNELTAAHKSLKFGTKVRVTNEKNGKSVVVRINDRGPYVGSRIIDLSKQAAQAIDMIGPGTATVTVEVLA